MTKLRPLLVPATIALLAGACAAEAPTDPTLCGHGCDQDDPINLPEGGEVRLELIKGQSGLGFEVRTTAWFASDQEPAAREFIRSPATWNTTLDNPCTDMRNLNYFPNGIPASRSYVDAGETVSMDSVAGDSSVVLDRYEDLENYTFFTTYDVGYQSDPDPDDVRYGSEYDVSLSGSDELPAMSSPTSASSSCRPPSRSTCPTSRKRFASSAART